MSSLTLGTYTFDANSAVMQTIDSLSLTIGSIEITAQSSPALMRKKAKRRLQGILKRIKVPGGCMTKGNVRKVTLKNDIQPLRSLLAEKDITSAHVNRVADSFIDFCGLVRWAPALLDAADDVEVLYECLADYICPCVKVNGMACIGWHVAHKLFSDNMGVGTLSTRCDLTFRSIHKLFKGEMMQRARLVNVVDGLDLTEHFDVIYQLSILYELLNVMESTTTDVHLSQLIADASRQHGKSLSDWCATHNLRPNSIMTLLRESDPTDSTDGTLRPALAESLAKALKVSVTDVVSSYRLMVLDSLTRLLNPRSKPPFIFTNSFQSLINDEITSNDWTLTEAAKQFGISKGTVECIRGNPVYDISTKSLMALENHFEMGISTYRDMLADFTTGDPAMDEILHGLGALNTSQLRKVMDIIEDARHGL